MRSAFFVVMTSLVALSSVHAVTLNTSEGEKGNDTPADPAKKAVVN